MSEWQVDLFDSNGYILASTRIKAYTYSEALTGAHQVRIGQLGARIASQVEALASKLRVSKIFGDEDPGIDFEDGEIGFGPYP